MPSHVDLSVLWVPIMPETSKLGPAMEEAGKDATETFGKATSGIGDKIHDSFTKATGKVKDVFHKAGSDASESMADGVKQQSSKVEDALEDAGKKANSKFKDAVGDIGKQMVGAISPDVKQQLSARVEDVVGGAFKTAFGDEGIAGIVGGAVSKAAGEGFSSWIDSIKDKVTGVKDAADKTRKAFADFSSGDTVGGVSKLVDSMGKLGIETKDLPGPLQDAVGKLGEAKSTAQGFADIFNGLPGKIGSVGKAIEGLAGPLAVALQASKDIDDEMRKSGLDPNAKGDAAKKQFEDAFHRIHRDASGKIVVDPKGSKPSGVDMSGVEGIGTGGDVLGSGSDAYDAFTSGAPVSGPGSIAPPTAPSAMPSFADSIPSSASSPTELHASGSRISNLFRVAQSLQGTPYSQQLRNDCSGMVSKLATAALGMTPAASFSTQNEGQWLMSHGFQPGMGGPGDLNIGWYNHGSDPNSGHTAATLPGGVNAESGGSSGAFALGGSVGAGSSQFDQHAHLAMNGAAGGLGTPSGAQHDPLYVMQADGAVGAGGAGSSSQDQGQQLGKGLVNGVLQEFGLDGSVFKSFGGSSNPLGFGAVKLFSSLFNSVGGLMQHGAGADSAGVAGGGGGIPGMSLIPGMGGLPAKGGVPQGPGGAQNVPTGDTTHNYYGPTGPQLNVTQNGVQSPTPDLQAAANGAGNRLPAMTAPNAGNLPG